METIQAVTREKLIAIMQEKLTYRTTNGAKSDSYDSSNQIILDALTNGDEYELLTEVDYARKLDESAEKLFAIKGATTKSKKATEFFEETKAHRPLAYIIVLPNKIRTTNASLLLAATMLKDTENNYLIKYFSVIDAVKFH